MTHQIEFDPRSSTAVVVVTGELDFDLVLGAYDEIDHRWGTEATNILWDFRIANFSRFTIKQIMAIIEKKNDESPRRQSVKSGVLVSGISERHLMRIFSDLSGDSKPHLQIFDDSKQAMAYFDLSIELE